MEPVDKFGNKIFPKTFDKMKRFAYVLLRNGYKEAQTKPNLFYRKDDKATFFADMRGTEEVPIWEDPSPLLYARFNDDVPRWLRKRLLREEFVQLGICRFSFYEEYEPEGLMFGEGGDGYCVVCGKDFQDEGDYCSQHCHKAHEDLGKVRCRVCGKVIDYDKAIGHHLSYSDDKTIMVCRGCHGRIHRGVRLPRLKPVDFTELNAGAQLKSERAPKREI